MCHSFSRLSGLWTTEPGPQAVGEDPGEQEICTNTSSDVPKLAEQLQSPNAAQAAPQQVCVVQEREVARKMEQERRRREAVSTATCWCTPLALSTLQLCVTFCLSLGTDDWCWYNEALGRHDCVWARHGLSVSRSRSLLVKCERFCHEHRKASSRVETEVLTSESRNKAPIQRIYLEMIIWCH